MMPISPGKTVLLLLLLTTAGVCFAQQYPGYPPYGYPRGMYPPPPPPQQDTTGQQTQPYQFPQQHQYPGSAQFRPPRNQQKQQNSNKGMSMGSNRGSRPQQQGWPQQGGMPFQQAPQQRYVPPRVEASVSDRNPFEQQSLVYTVRIISGGNLTVANPQPPQVDSLVIRRLGEPTTYSSQASGQQEIITEHQYLLMPLQSGNIVLPAVRANGSQASGSPFDIVDKDSIVLDVRPAAENVQPWLPLYNLQIQAKLLNAETPSAGNPITLEVETTVVGATGTQIPSIASQLQSDDYRIYPANSSTEGTIAADGRVLLGRRVESFTLVPQFGGRLTIPAVHLDWWNINYNRREVASLPTRLLQVAGPENPNDDVSDAEGISIIPEGASLWFWIPLAGALIIVIFGWLRALLGSGRMPGLAWLSKLFKDMLGDLYRPVAAVAVKASPRRHFHRLRTWTGRNLPVSWKLWFCLHAVDKEEDPEHWGHALQILASKHLGVRSHASLQHLGKSIAACHPSARADQVEELMRELDQAIYGSKPIISFPDWKKNFKRQIKPSLFPIRFRYCETGSADSARLPSLNPGS